MDHYLNICICIYIIISCILSTITIIYGISDNQFTCKTNNYWWCSEFTNVKILLTDIQYKMNICTGKYIYDGIEYLCSFDKLTDIYEYDVNEYINGYIKLDKLNICYTSTFVNDYINKNDNIHHTNIVNILAIVLIPVYFIGIIILVHIIIPYILSCGLYLKVKIKNNISQINEEEEEEYELVPNSEFNV